MSKINWNAELINLFKEINKREKNIEEGEKNKNDVSEQYTKINISIKNFIEKNHKQNDDLAKDIVESLKLINSAYENNSKNYNFNKYLLEKEYMVNKCLNKQLNEKIEDKELKKEEDDDFMKDFEIITLPKLNEIIQECIKIQNMLNNDIMKEEINKNNNLINDISLIIVEANKLMNSKKIIDEEAIKRLNDEINAIKKEYVKIERKKKNIEKYIYESFDCKKILKKILTFRLYFYIFLQKKNK